MLLALRLVRLPVRLPVRLLILRRAVFCDLTVAALEQGTATFDFVSCTDVTSIDACIFALRLVQLPVDLLTCRRAVFCGLTAAALEQGTATFSSDSCTDLTCFGTCFLAHVPDEIIIIKVLNKRYTIQWTDCGANSVRKGHIPSRYASDTGLVELAITA